MVVGDSNIVGIPLSAMLRDAGAATVTVCHRIAYRNLFADRRRKDVAAFRASADACLPRLPGPTGMAYRQQHQNWAVDRPKGDLVEGEVWVKEAAPDDLLASVDSGDESKKEQNVTVSVSHSEGTSTVEIQVRLDSQVTLNSTTVCEIQLSNW